MSIKMIVTDLDRTLLRTDKTISDYTADVLKRCLEKDIKIVLATARPLRLVRDYLEIIPANGVIANNGGTISIDNATICEYMIPEDTKNAILYDLSHNEVIKRMSAESGDTLFSNYRPPKILASSYSKWNAVFTDFTSKVDTNFCKISIHSDYPETVSAIVAKYPELHVYSVTGEDLFSILPESSTKWNGIKTLALHFNIEIDETVAFGDDYNDIEMLENCRTGVTVDNAIDEAKTAADFICDSNDNDGVARWIEQNVLTEGKCNG